MKKNLIVNIKNNNDCEKVLPGFEEVNADVLERAEELVCWNCSVSLSNKIISNPIDYINGIFYTNGNFCSYGCGLRHIIDNSTPTELWERVSMLHIYYAMNTNNNSKIVPPPNKLSLKIFGGSMSHTEYHSGNTSSVDTLCPPILPINNMEYSHDNKQNDKNTTGDYKIFRKTPVKNNHNIYNTMKLVVE